MNDHDYGRTIGRLSPSRRAVFEVIVASGPMTDEDLVEEMNASRSRVIPRRSELMQMGLVRGAGSRATASGGKTTIWEVVPPAEVEQSREIAEQRGPRRQEIARWPLEDKVRVARALLRDRKVNDALQAPAGSGPGTRRARARAREEVGRDRRERTEAIKREEAANGQLVALLKAKDHLKRNVEAIREVGFFLEEEMERTAEGMESRIPDWAWPQILEILDEAVDINDSTHERIARHIGHDSRTYVQIIDGSSPEAAAARPMKVVSPPSAAEPSATTDG